MKNIYYAWWADSIIRIQHFNPKMKDWKMRVFQLNTLLNATNYGIIAIWLKYLNIFTIPRLDIDIFPGDVLDSFIGFIINFASPFILLNYFLIFYKNKYEKIIFSIWDLDDIEVSICKPRLFFIPDPIYYKRNKYRFNLHDILDHFPNNNLIQFVNYKYYSKNQKELLEILMNRKPFAKYEEEYVFKRTVKEHILFLKENLLPVINGEMWIDELLKQKKK